MTEFKAGDKVELSANADAKLFAEFGIKHSTKYTVEAVADRIRVTLKGYKPLWIHEKWLIPARTK